MSDTPRTDKQVAKHRFLGGGPLELNGPFADFARELESENAELRKALDDAATSLCSISQQAGFTEELEEMSQVRGYAYSRYSAAIDAARAKEGDAS
jgi:hypothetical protein